MEKKLRKAIQKTAEATGDLIGKLKLQIKEQVCRKSLLRSTQWNCIQWLCYLITKVNFILSSIFND